MPSNQLKSTESSLADNIDHCNFMVNQKEFRMQRDFFVFEFQKNEVNAEIEFAAAGAEIW